MATQGILTVINGNRVVAKIITGSDGDNAIALARAIIAADMRCENPKLLFDLAIKEKFGSAESLVVLCRVGYGEIQEYTLCGDQPDPLYESTFECEFFNPRWSIGTADWIVRLDLGTNDITVFEYDWGQCEGS